MKLVTDLRSNRARTISLGNELAEKRRSLQLAAQRQEEEEIKRQIAQAPVIAEQLIVGLPDFLRRASDEHNMAYVVYRDGCKPFESRIPGYIRQPREFQRHDLSEYKIRRYLHGTIRHVALWGLRQGFQVGLGEFSKHCLEDWIKFRGTVPVYESGTFQDERYIPTSTEYLFFAW